MFTVGITGGIGSGKSTVCRVFGVLGIPVFSSDDAGKQALNEDPVVRSQLAAAFGEGLHPNGKLDRKALADRVFSDADALARLNAIVHPAVRNAFTAWAAGQRAPYVINEAALLVETGAYRQLDQLLVVTAPEEQRISRVVLRDGTAAESVRSRMHHQATDEQRAAAADGFIVNDGRVQVIPQVLAAHLRLLQLAAS